MSDSHEVIIDDDSSMIGRKYTIRLQEDNILYLGSLELYPTTDDIVHSDTFSLGYLESDRTLLPCRDARASLVQWKISTVSIIAGREPQFFLLLSESREPIGTTETIISSSIRTHLVQSRSIDMRSFTLDIGSFPSIMMRTLIRDDTEYIMCLEDHVDCAFHDTIPVSIFYS